MTSALPLAITCGDPAGIGPDVIRAWAAEANREKLAPVAFIGPESWLATLPPDIPQEHRIAVGPSGFRAVPGRPEAPGTMAAIEALEEAARGCIEGRYRAVVSGPVNKSQMGLAGFGYPGQTEFFAARWGGRPTMAFVGAELRITLATWHIPLARVPAAIDREAVARAVDRAGSLARALGATEPRIAVCGLNPHAGEGGLLGNEERDRLDPWLDELRHRWPGLTRTIPGDTAFHRQRRGEFDVVVALYHDQGLAPLKTLEFDTAVNATLGLPFVRTSPDHGTAYDLAGSGRASFRSFGHAIALAVRLADHPMPHRTTGP